MTGASGALPVSVGMAWPYAGTGGWRAPERRFFCERAREQLGFSAMRLARFLEAEMPADKPDARTRAKKAASRVVEDAANGKTKKATKKAKARTKSDKSAAGLDVDSPPAGLEATGLRVWRDFHAELPEGWSFDPRELQALEAACRLFDRLDQLDLVIDQKGVTVAGSTGQLVVNPALIEFRQCAAAVSKLLGELQIPNGQDAVPETAATKRGRKAAQVRWSRADNWSREALEHRRRGNGKAH